MGRGCAGRAGHSSAWLRVRRVIDVVPVTLAVLTPMPALFKAPQRSSRAFLAAGLRGDDVFLLLDPARLRAIRNDPDISVFVAKFVEEARDRSKALGAALLRLEQTPGAMDVIAEAMRDAHTIKGSALMLGFTDISQIAHKLEDLFVAAKKNPALLDGDAFDVVFGAVDQMSTRVEQLARGQMDAVEVGDICARLAAVLRGV